MSIANGLGTLLLGALLAACGTPNSLATDGGALDATAERDDAAARESSVSSCELEPSLTAEQCALVRTMALSEALPPARNNAHADELPAARFGFALFYDARFSSDGEQRCASCHAPEARFDDDRALPRGQGPVYRNSPTILNAARYAQQFWDGRAEYLWAQPLFAIENPREMNFSRLELAHRIALSFRSSYEAVFGPLPPLEDTARFPAQGRPGEPSYDGMSAQDRAAIDTVADNVGRALEAYMRKIAAGPSDFDRFVRGAASALNATQRTGLGVFFRSGCASCHAGENFTDQRYYNAGVPSAPGAPPDRGRAAVVAAPAMRDEGAFRTPSLRNLRHTAPYGHSGVYATLGSFLDAHLAGGAANGFVGTVDPLLVRRALTASEREALLAFLDALTGDPPPFPWNDWPAR